jgi:hypothetical protein
MTAAFITTNPAALANLIVEAAAEATRREWDMDYTAAQKWSAALSNLSKWAAEEQVAIPMDADGNFAPSVLDALSDALDNSAQRACYGWAI